MVTCGGGSADCERIITFSIRTMSRRWPSIMVHIFCCLFLAVTVAHAVNTSPSDINAPCRSGGAAVEGTFEKVKRQGRYTFYDEVTATRVTCAEASPRPGRAATSRQH